MLRPIHLRDLLVDPATHPRGQPHLSATSGLVQVGPWLYLVSDDEHHLGMLQAGSAARVELHRLLPGDLPRDKGERKRRKPDLEALAVLPATSSHPHGALLALGSGSRPNRRRGWCIALDAASRPMESAGMLDLSLLYEPLGSTFADLNIEGAFVAGDSFHLLQRANKGAARNAAIEYALRDVQDWNAGRRDTPPEARQIRELDLGDAGGVPFGVTDGAALSGGGWIVSAVAEDTGDSYNDGACAGSALAWIGSDGRVQRLEQLAGAPKVEGIALAGKRLLMVTDADDPAVASQLLAVEPDSE